MASGVPTGLARVRVGRGGPICTPHTCLIDDWDVFTGACQTSPHFTGGLPCFLRHSLIVMPPTRNLLASRDHCSVSDSCSGDLREVELCPRGAGAEPGQELLDNLLGAQLRVRHQSVGPQDALVLTAFASVAWDRSLSSGTGMPFTRSRSGAG